MAEEFEPNSQALNQDQISPEAQKEINQKSAQAQEVLEQDPDSKKFVREVNRLGMRHQAGEHPEGDISTVSVLTKDAVPQRLGLIKQLMGTPGEPILTNDGIDHGQKIEVFNGRSTIHNGMYLQVNSTQEGKITSVEVGYPLKARLNKG